MARPKALDDEKRDLIVALSTAGMRLGRIAEYVGCHRKTIERERIENAEFDERIRRARMATDLRPLEAMRRASQTHWRAAAWMLQRDDRQQTARRSKPTGQIAPKHVDTLARELHNMIQDEVFDRDIALCMRLQQRATQIVGLWAAVPGSRSARGSTASSSLGGPTPSEIKESIKFLTQRQQLSIATANH